MPISHLRHARVRTNHTPPLRRVAIVARRLLPTESSPNGVPSKARLTLFASTTTSNPKRARATTARSNAPTKVKLRKRQIY
jgi:hypothetical protein